MRYLLDTNAVIALLNEPSGGVSRHARRHAPSDVGVSSVVLHELYFGAYGSQRRDHNTAVVDGLRLEVVAFDREDAKHAGEIRAALAEVGLPIGAYDILIAGQARARALTLVTRNTREFKRVDNLHIVNWEPPNGR